MQLRQYQLDVQKMVFHFWTKGKRHVMPVLPTGSGKTAIMADTARYKKPGTLGLAAAHRSELVGQISCALAGEGLQHDIIASKGTLRTICDEHMERFGKVMFNPTAEWRVASVDTLNKRDISSWAGNVSMAFMDEGHHVAGQNKWHRCVAQFENAWWMLPTATPLRSDGKGLGSHASGVVDAMVEGPRMSWMIDQGFLTDFEIESFRTEDLDLTGVELDSEGDYKKGQLSAATKRSRKLVGNVVDKYISQTPGKLAICFAVDHEDARKITAEFNARGVPADFIHGEHTAEERRTMLRKFKNRETLVLVNVDLFGEGFDLPAIEVCIFARPTASYSLYVQQFGRALRLMISSILMAAWDTYTPAQRKAFIASSEKPIAKIHDHVGNMFHFGGPPTVPREWSLDDSASRRSTSSNTIMVRKCLNEMCQETYERYLPQCPWCGFEPPPPKGASTPKELDGDLSLYTREMCNALFGCDTVEAAWNKAMSDFIPVPQGVTQAIARSIYNKGVEKQQAQAQLREILPFALPGNDRTAHRRFYKNYGVDTLEALNLGEKDALELRERIVAKLRGAV